MTAFRFTQLSAVFVFTMRNKVAKRLRKEAENETVGKSSRETKIVYKAKKKQYKTR
jgi:hypothetical protein